MPSIVFLARALDLGGAQRQLVELASGLHAAGWKVHVMTFYRGGALEPALEKTGVTLTCLEKGGRWSVVSFLWRTARAIRSAKPDVVHGYLDVSNILLACLRPALLGARIVWGVRASNVDLSQYEAIERIIFRTGVALSRFADLIVCNSQAGRDYCAAQGYRTERMVVIPNGVDVQLFRPDPLAREAVRSEWKLSAGERLVGLIGRLDPMKDHPNFIRAAARVLAARPRTRFVCVGAGPAAYLGGLRKTAEDLGIADCIIWAGARHDMWRVYNALDLAVSSSLTEGTSNALAEAMASGVPCVATEVGDSKALLGDLGILCPPGDSAALAQAILQALADPSSRAAALRKHVSQQFSSAALVTRTAEQLTRLVGPEPLVLDKAVKG